ncbi:MAG: thiamine phosphate synthase [bacterium]
MLEKCELYCITRAPVNSIGYEEMVERACAGGANIIQFRHKGLVDTVMIETAKRLRDICKKHAVFFIINNHPEVARDVDADGVHIGQDDMSISQARHVIGPGKLIGLSTHSFEQALKAQLKGADYIGFGPIFATPTKPDYKPIGLSDIDSVVRKVEIPVFVIGGINADNVGQVIRAGAERVAVVRAAFNAEHIETAVRNLRSQIESAKKDKIYQEI